MSHLNTSYLGSKSIFLQSNEAQVSINDSHKIFFLNEVIEPPPDVSILAALTSFEMPYSMYNFNEDQNDSISIKIGATTFTASVGSRNYTATQLATKITQLYSDTTTTGLAAAVVCTYDTGSNRFIFTSTSNFIITATTMEKELGFRNNIPSNDNVAIAKITSPNIVNVSGSSSIYFRINNLGIYNLDSRGKKSGTISKININVNPNEFIFFQQQESIYYPVQDKQLTYLDIELTDENGLDFILNGGEFSCSLTLHFQQTIPSREIRREYLLENRIRDKMNIDEIKEETE